MKRRRPNTCELTLKKRRQVAALQKTRRAKFKTRRLLISEPIRGISVIRGENFGWTEPRCVFCG